ncbi:MAG: hypothetical protein ACI9LM_002169 [Alteromonadaceae bacterium]|jgi:hypothetical protein
MNVHVYDTHVRTTTGSYLHFDVFVDDLHKKKVKKFAQDHLAKLGITPDELELNSCQFCHNEIANPEIRAVIERQGHYILQLESTYKAKNDKTYP